MWSPEDTLERQGSLHEAFPLDQWDAKGIQEMASQLPFGTRF